MAAKDIDLRMQQYVDNNEIAGGALQVRKNGSIVYRNKWGYADLASQKPIEYDSIYRMMSLTKVAVAVAVMKLIENGKIGLDAPLSEYIPAFREMKVVSDQRFAAPEGEDLAAQFAQMMLLDPTDVKTVPAEREVTIRDLLSHSSGLEMGSYGFLMMFKCPFIRTSTAQMAERYAAYPLDFQPGTGTGYSSVASFDLLLRVCEIVTGLDGESFLKKELFEPLEMNNSAFYLSSEQESRLVRLYKRENGVLRDVSGTNDDMDSLLHRGPGYPSGSGGLFSTLEDYEHLAHMLCDEGMYKGARYLKLETVKLMRTEAPAQHLEPEPGMVWGLGVRVRQDREKGGFAATNGTFGWSGAFGTHLFVSPADHLEAVFVSSRSDAGGSGFYISRAVEDMVFDAFGGDNT